MNGITCSSMSFHDAEKHYLYDFPEPKEAEECSVCGRMTALFNLVKIGDDSICEDCVQKAIKNHEIEEEEIKPWQN